MSRYVLRDLGYSTYKVITRGRKQVGRVCSTTFGHYLGVLGKSTAKGATEREAFDNVVAKHLGFATVAQLDAKNQQVRAANQARKRAARFVVGELLAGNFEPFGDWLEAADKDNENGQ